MSLGEHVPKLRFPGFEGEWEERTLEKCCRCFDNKRKPISAELREKGEVPYYGANGIQDYVKDFIFNGKFLLLAEDGGHFDEYSKKPIAQYITGKSWVNNHAHVLSGKDNCLTEYIYFSLIHRDIRKYINGTCRAKLNQEDMWDIKIHVPQVKLQEKISTFLFLIEERIAAQRKLVELLKKYKRGLLREVFEENIDGKSCPFSEIACRRNEKISQTKNSKLDCIELEHIEPETGMCLGNVPLRIQNSLKNLCKPNDIIFGKLRPYLRKFLFSEFECAVSSETWILTASDGIYPKFLFYLIQSEPFMRAANVSSGTKMPRSEWSNVANAKFYIPNAKKQKSIADCFSLIDVHLQKNQKSLSAMEVFKRGLLQQMFI